MKALKRIALFLAAFLCAESVFSQSRPVANKISAMAGAEKNIEIVWAFPERTEPKITGAKVYRAAKPISSYSEIERLSPVAKVTGFQYLDTVSKGGEYFYAVIAMTEKGDYKAIIPGMKGKPQAKIRNPIPKKIFLPFQNQIFLEIRFRMQIPTRKFLFQSEKNPLHRFEKRLFRFQGQFSGLIKSERNSATKQKKALRIWRT